MEYDRWKDMIGEPMRVFPWFRKFAYKLFEFGFLRVRYVKRELRTIMRACKYDCHIFDAGFGFGPYMDFLLRTYPGVKITGLEIKDEQVEDCRQYFKKEKLDHRVNLVSGDLLTYDREDTYNMAIAIDIMEHIEDDVRVMKNLLNSLKKGGFLLIHTPGAEVDSRYDDTEHFFVGEHVRDGYHPDELREKLFEAGFSKVQVKFSYGKLGMISWWLMQGIPFRFIDKFPLGIVLLPLYYMIASPFADRFMKGDLGTRLKDGKGLIAIAKK